MTRWKIKHQGELIGYCFAHTADSAVKTFREHHQIPAEVSLTAE